MITQTNTNDVGVRQLGEHEVEAVSGGSGHLAVWALVQVATAVLLASGEYKQGVKDLS